MPITDKFLFFLIKLRNLFFILGLRKNFIKGKNFFVNFVSFKNSGNFSMI